MDNFIIWCGLAVIAGCLGSVAHHEYEKNRKYKLIEKHPERTVELLQSIDRQEQQYNARWQQAFEPAKKEKSKGSSAGKLIVLVLCVLYILSPLDIIPDVIPVAGWGDDLVAGLIGLRQLMK